MNALQNARRWPTGGDHCRRHCYRGAHKRVRARLRGHVVFRIDAGPWRHRLNLGPFQDAAGARAPGILVCYFVATSWVTTHRRDRNDRYVRDRRLRERWVPFSME
jgi:hypothetical protein